MRSLYSVALAAVALALSGCLSDAKDPNAPPPGTGDGVPEVPVASATFRAQFDPLNGILPYPNDILGFVAAPAEDGTLNVPVLPTWPLAAVVNQLDGFSTNARIQANFTRRVAPATLNDASVYLLEVAISPQTKAVIGLSDETICKINPAVAGTCAALGLPSLSGNPFLVQGIDYAVSVAPDFDAGGQTIQLKPLRPLNSNRANLFTPGTENGYLLFLTDGITDTDGNPAQPDTAFAQIRAGFIAGAIQLPPPGSPLPPDLTIEQLLGLFIAAHLSVGQFVGIPPGNVVVTASFTTLDATVVLESAVQASKALPSQFFPYTTPIPLPGPGDSVIPAGTPVTTDLVFALLGRPDPTPNTMLLYGGVLSGLDYYLKVPENQNDASTIREWWMGAGGSTLTKHNPFPVAKDPEAIVDVPLLVAVPLDGEGVPIIGGPVVVIGHGLNGNRMTLLAMAEKWASVGATVVAMDAPLHGIPYAEIDFENLAPEEIGAIIAQTPEALFRVPGVPERTFDLDLITGQGISGGVPGAPDDVIDASGAHWINLASPLTNRDQWRQAGLDLVQLFKSIPDFEITPPGVPPSGVPNYGGSSIHYDGLSLGGFNGTIALGAFGSDSNVATATLGVFGGVISDYALDSASFGPVIEASFQAQGLVPNTGIYNNLFRDLQHALDAGDPISFAADAAANHSIHLITVEGDTVAPNSASKRIFDTMNAVEVVEPGPNDTSANGASSLCFIEGSHGSQADPTASLAATIEMQTQTVAFGASFGTVLPISNPLLIGSFATGDCLAPNRQRANTQ